MGKAVLHSLIDMLSEADTETIYNVLVKFIPSDKPFDDEIEAINQSRIEIAEGNVFRLTDVDFNM